MQLIISEKPIAGKRIAEILAEGKVLMKEENSVPFFEFKFNKNDCILIPLKGHIVDVDFPKRFAPWIGTDLKSLVKAEILYMEKEKGIIRLLKKYAGSASKVIIATDSDREGESIGLEAVNILKKLNKKITVLRANFSVITEEEIIKSFNSLNELDVNLADSADARREIDLVWGATLTRFLSIVSGRMGKEFLSAGRVQSPVLALVVDREKERLKFKPEKYFEIEAFLEKNNIKFSALHEKGRIKDKTEAENIIKRKSSPLIVTDIKKTKKKLRKPIPFNTTAFLRAATALGFNAGRAMDIAEKLYQKGLTSYPRTDNTVYPKSLNLKSILKKLSKLNEFKSKAEILLSKKELIPSRGKKATKDHPPIYPVAVPKEKLEVQEKKIYDLIVSRFFATLSDDAEILSMKVTLKMKEEKFIAHGLTYIDLGWKAFYPYSKSEETVLPELKKDDKVKLLDLKLYEKETKPLPRYSQGHLIQLMEKLNLGTKSTRHEIIRKLYSRKYLLGLKALEPSNVAFAVIDALEKYDGAVIKPKMTAELEKEMDLIVAGKKTKKEVVIDSRNILLEVINELIKNKNYIGSEIRTALRKDVIIGDCTDENCNGKLIIRKSFRGKRFIGCTEYPKCTVTYGLPQKGVIHVTNKKCSECGMPVIKITGKRYSFEMCINSDCKTKEKWKKRREEKLKKQEKALQEKTIKKNKIIQTKQ